jgi:hypothetical protein
MGTVSLVSVPVFTAQAVLAIGDRFQMIWIYTRSCTTKMI